MEDEEECGDGDNKVRKLNCMKPLGVNRNGVNDTFKNKRHYAITTMLSQALNFAEPKVSEDQIEFH